MAKSILYLGDTELKTAASYLAGIMTFYDISFDYLPSGRSFSGSLLDNDYQAVIISDYPAKNFSTDHLNSLAEEVKAGTGLLMIGGWESFTGPNCEYNDTVLKEVLPVIMKSGDDRISCPQPCLVEKIADHKIVGSLPFDQTPPAIGGFNQFKAKPEASTILIARRFAVSRKQKEFSFTPCEKPDPLLVVGSFGKGRVVAFASDVAPHWVGGLVDWGDSRVEAQAKDAEAVEVGNWYAELFSNMVKWIAGGL
ncbi:MAG: glutamine amidotransferase [Planctomycetota bacterium]|jgi:uncharacterized membrane protein